MVLKANVALFAKSEGKVIAGRKELPPRDNV